MIVNIMEMIIFTAFITSWILCGYLSYILLRHYERTRFGTWTRGDRKQNLTNACLGPICLLLIMFVWIVYIISKGDDEPAKW